MTIEEIVQRLEEIKQREAKATKKSWYNIDDTFIVDSNGDAICQFFGEDGLDYDNALDNIEFIVHAREDVPLLVAEIERLHTEIDDVLGYYDQHIEDFENEVKCLQESRPKICDVCFTSSWQPCPPLTAGSVDDGNGDWMVCGHCRLVQAYEQQTQAIDRLQNELIGSQEEAAYYHSKWEEKLEG